MTVMKNIIVPAEQYDFTGDSRILIPFIEFEKIGFMDKVGTVVVKPEYTAYHGEFDTEDSLVIVALNHLHGYERKTSAPAVYCRPKYGLLNSKGELVVEIKYLLMSAPKGGSRLYAVQNMDYQYGAIDEHGNEVIPFGKYSFLDTFYKGHSRVKIYDKEAQKDRWGIIDEKDQVIEPLIHDRISNFVDKEDVWFEEYGNGKSKRWEDVDL